MHFFQTCKVSALSKKELRTSQPKATELSVLSGEGATTSHANWVSQTDPQSGMSFYSQDFHYHKTGSVFGVFKVLGHKNIFLFSVL